jgi:hypothetical protein
LCQCAQRQCLAPRTYTFKTVQAYTNKPSDLACYSATEMILRVLLPDLDHTTPCLLLGALLSSTQKEQALLTAITVSVVPFELLPPLSQVEQQLANSRVCLPTAQAKLAVLGIWQPGPHQSAAASCKDPHSPEYSIWLVLQGSQCLQQALGRSSWHQQRWTAPTCNIQQSILPPGTESVQVTGTARIRIGAATPGAGPHLGAVQQAESATQQLQQHLCVAVRPCMQLFLYNVPAQQPGCTHVQLPLPAPTAQLPWMSREPGMRSRHLVCSCPAILQSPEAAWARCDVRLLWQS